MSDKKFNLALELSGKISGVAIGCGDNLLGTEIIQKQVRHDDSLMPALDRLVTAHGYTPSELTEIYVSVGPGGFTGLRIAVTTAKMLAYSLGVKIVAVPSAMVVAVSVNPNKGKLAVCMARKREMVWSTLFSYDNKYQIWVLCEDGRLVQPEQLIDHSPISLVSGDSTDSELIQLCHNNQIDFSEAQVNVESCWRAGRYLAEKGEYIHAEKLSPIYAREPEAVRLWETRIK